MTDINKDTCWYREDGAAEMNRFHDIEIKGHDLSNHGHIMVLRQLLAATDCQGEKLIDVGCGTAMLSDYTKEFEYYGCDLPHILSTCAMRNYPGYFYRSCDLYQDDMAFIHEAEVVVCNGIIDVMERPLLILDKLLKQTKNYFVLHRQEMSANRETQVIINGSYGSTTYHSIINYKDFDDLLEENNFEIIKELNLFFSNWEKNGTSFLLRKRKSWALHELDYKLKKHIGPKQNGFFIEAGANDGLRQSNTMFFEFYKNWTGILIEPIPELARQCKENRSPKTTVVNCAVVSPARNLTAIQVWYTPDCHGLMSVVHDENAINTLGKAHELHPVLMTVPGRTLNSILDIQPIGQPVIDLLVLDMEGQEGNALRGLDLEKYQVKWILVEIHDDSNPEVFELLGSRYITIDKLSDHDYLFKRI